MLAVLTLSLRLLAPALVTNDGAAPLCKDLEAAYRSKDSTTAVRLFDRLLQQFQSFSPADRALTVKTIEAAFDTRRDAGDDVDQLFIGAGAALAEMDDLGEKALQRAIKLKHVRAKPAVLATLVEGLGERKNVAMVPDLMTYLSIEKPLGVNAPVVASAPRALAHYREADPKLRKQIVEKLMAAYVDLSARVEAEHAKAHGDDQVDVGFQQIEAPLLLALRTLAGANFEDLPSWKTWWAKNKDVDWSKPAGDPPPGKDPAKEKGQS